MKRSHTLVCSDIGLFHYNAKDYVRSIEAFRFAFEFEKNDPIVLGNAVNTCIKMERFEEGFAILDPHIRRFTEYPDLRLYHAVLLTELGEPQEGLKTYASVFEGGHRDDDAFEVYVLLLDEHRGRDAAKGAVEKYLKAKESLAARILLATLHDRWGERGKAIELLETLQLGREPTPEILFPLVDLTYEDDRFLESLEHCKALLDAGFDAPAVHFLRGRAEYALKWYRKAKVSFETVLKKTPADEEARSYLDHTAAMLGQSSHASIKDPIEPVALPDALGRGVPGADPPAGARELGAFYLRRITAVAFEKGKDYRVTSHRLVKVVDARGVGAFSSFQFPFDPLGEAVFLNRLRVLDEKGRVISEGRVEDAYVIDDTSGAASQRKILPIPVPGLAPGRVVDLAVTKRALSPPKLMWYSSHCLSTATPSLTSALYVRADPKAYRAHVSGPVAVSHAGGGTIWKVENPPVFHWEPFSPDYETFLPMVRLNDASRTWDGEVNEYLESIEDLLKGDATLETLVADVLKGVEGKEAKIRALARHVQKTLTYKAVAFGKRATVPRSVSEIVRNRYGDCKEHSLFLHLLLRKAGLPSNLVLARVGGPVREELASLDQFDHMIVAVPGPGGSRFIDCTNKEANLLASPPLSLAGKRVLILDRGTPRLERVGVAARGADRLDSQREVRVDGKGEGRVRETLTLHGAYASAMRAYLKAHEPARRASELQGDVFSSTAGAVLEGLDIKDLETLERPLVLVLTYRIRNLFQTVGDRLAGRVPAVWERDYLTLPTVKERRTPVHFGNAVAFHSSIRVIAPEGYGPADAGEGEKKGTHPAPWTVTRSVLADRLEVQFDLARPFGRQPASAYAKFVAAMEAGLEALEGNVVFEKKD
jgi:tetratricopeptide (TPR) repeat protein